MFKIFNPFEKSAESDFCDEIVVDREKDKMIAWAAGIYEGEGTTTKQVPIMITQKDTWILYKLQELFGGRVCAKNYEKIIFRWYLCGPDGRDVLKLFLPYLSPRRIKQIEDKDVFSIIRRHNTCNRGHELTVANTRISLNGHSSCRICEKVYQRKDKVRRRFASSI